MEFDMPIGKRTKRETGMPHRAMEEGENPRSRIFDGMRFRLEGWFPSIRSANYFLSEYKEDFYNRKVRLPGRQGYLVYVCEKGRR